MFKINLSTLFTNPVNNAAFVQAASFRGSERLGAFQNEGLEPLRDSFSTNPILEKYSDKARVEQIIKSDPKLAAYVKKYGLHVNMDVLKEMV